MTLTNFSKLLAATLCLATSYSHADSERPLFSLTMAESGVSQTNSDGSLSHSTKSESRILPIWGNEARAKGYDLPEPFGASYGYMNLRQDIIIDSIKFQFTNPLIEERWKDQIIVNAGDTRERNETHMLKLDTWVLPFLNVYGVYGTTKGKSKTNLDNIVAFGDDETYRNIPFELSFKGKTYGGGATFAGGYNQFFATLDANYTRTNLDILDGDISAFVVTPRVGYEFVFEPLFTGQGNAKVQVWVGAMYQDITQRFKGDVSKLNLPSEISELFGMVQSQTDIKFDVEQHLAHKWNNTVGARFEITRNFNILSEVGFGNRNSLFVSGEFRF
ncbi:hypothetical protein [Xenorhabdus bovienii]|uniref:Lipoprotein n=1 Tax=Xenorhabdus bovienii TaxID=40576 RepID=A0AAJ1J685_XENBV|nr:hypothetical protein [Xenorhabdus bovienii]MDE1477870.1 hypothetical protein [Xenorhabdus bovienii]MDE1490722.1 hypothetical protein [Xenorhabdus bovienii]MDE9436663.1 hypothetical protein [Xenorhabdus bovienii]MDE9461183.1 hypothetical protein [Xenorhabdus bovienii]MDE9469488.1 hypothetical protein [Xenorhabdus bovienii]